MYPVPPFMRDFQKEALELAEIMLDGGKPLTRYRFLTSSFKRTFLHYTRKTPGHWTDPAGTWCGYPDLPRVGSCVCLAFMAGHVCGLPCEETDELVMMYHQFAGAMSPSFVPEDVYYAWLAAETACCIYPAEHHYALLAENWKKGALTYSDPSSRWGAVAEKVKKLSR